MGFEEKKKIQRSGNVVKLTESNGQVRLTIPRALAEAKRYAGGDHVQWVVNDRGNLELTRPLN